MSDKIIEIPLSEVLTQVKNIIEIDDNTDYKLVTISNKSVVKMRSIKKGANIKSKKGYKIKSGQFIYSRLSVHNNAYGIVPDELDGAFVTSEMPVFNIDKKILVEYLFYYLQSPVFKFSMDQLTKGVGRVRVKEQKLLTFKIKLPSIDVQKSKVIQIKKKETSINSMKFENKNQKNLITKLKQLILQEAIQGKLTKDWRRENPNIEPACKLLERVKAEKEQLIADKKIKKEKPLPSITKQETPFELPDGWVWCRLGEIFSTSSGGTPTKGNYKYWSGNITWYKSGELKDNNNLQTDSSESITQIGLSESSAKLFPIGTLLIAMYGATAGKLAILGKEAATNQAICGFYQNNFISTKYLFNFLLSNRNKMIKDSWGMSQPNISQTYLRNFIFALPPIKEQEEIIKKVDSLIKKIEKIEEEIKKSEVNREKLMQSALKEAFEN